MARRVLAGLAVAAAISAGVFASTTANVTAAPDQPIRAGTVQDTRVMPPDESGMVALQEHARVNMLLYSGHLAGSDLASVRSTVNAVALTLPAGAR